MALIHCRRHQKEDNHVSKVYALADKAGEKATTQQVFEMALIPRPLEATKHPYYTMPEIEWAQQQD